MQKKWAEIHRILEKVLTPAQVAVWISPLRPASSTAAQSGELVLLAKNTFIAEFVKNNFLSAIKKAASTVMSTRDVTIVSPSHGQDQFVPAPQSAQPHGSALKRPEQAPALLAPARPEETPEFPSPRALQAAPAGASGQAAYALNEAPIVRGNETADFMHISTMIHARSAEAGAEREASPVRAVPSPRPLPGMQLALPMRLDAPEDTGPAGSNTRKAWRFNFEDFVVGPSNELAYAASRSVCESLSGTNMLFLSSAPGLGKTHLMHAVGQTLTGICNRRSPNIEYLTAEEFASRFYLSLKGSDTDSFKARYRNLDALLIEDVHFLQGKEKMQAELLATIKAVRERNGKIIFSSSFSPRDLINMDEQLQSRLCAGLLSIIQTPDLETRKRIFHKKAALHQVNLPDDVADLLAGHIRTDVRQIESCLHNLILKAKLFNTGITMRMAWEVISNYASHSPIMDLDGIIKYVSQCFGISQDKLFSKSRKQEYVVARNTAFFLARKHTDLSLEAIGETFNRRHSTVLKGITNLEREIGRQSPMGRQICGALEMIEKNGNLGRPESMPA